MGLGHSNSFGRQCGRGFGSGRGFGRRPFLIQGFYVDVHVLLRVVGGSIVAVGVLTTAFAFGLLRPRV